MADTWTVRGIEPETRATVKVAARRSGKTMGQWINDTLLRTATDEAVGRNEVAPRLEDTLAKLVESMERQNDRLAALEKRSWLEKIFNR